MSVRLGQARSSALLSVNSIFNKVSMDFPAYMEEVKNNPSRAFNYYTDIEEMIKLQDDLGLSYDIPEEIKPLIRIANIDSQTRLPFTFLKSSKILQSQNIIVFAFDFWDTYIPLVKRFQMLQNELEEKSVSFLLLNFPGQSLTTLPAGKVMTNYECAKCIDQVLYYLDSEGEVNLIMDRLHMFGVGYGANICLLYSSLSSS